MNPPATVPSPSDNELVETANKFLLGRELTREQVRERVIQMGFGTVLANEYIAATFPAIDPSTFATTSTVAAMIDPVPTRELLKRAKTLFSHINGCTCEECVEYAEHWVKQWLARND